MDWQTILTSGVIAAIVAGIIELVKLSNSNKTRYIIQQREEWRETIREIADEILLTKHKDIKKPLTRLKTRINPYGEFVEYQCTSCFDKNATEKEQKQQLLKEENLKEKFYLKDGHIHKVINQLENNNDFDSNKELLIKYLSLLMKFDWERSKIESTVNKKRVVSLFFVICSLIICVISFYKEWSSLSAGLIVAPMIFVLLYLMPDIMIWVNNSQSVIIDKISDVAVRKASIFVLGFFVVILVIVTILKKPLASLAMFFMLFGFILSVTNILDKRDFVKEYIHALEKANKNTDDEANE